MQTIKNIKNSLLKRHELIFVLESDKNPGFEEMRKIISEDFKKKEDHVDVYNVKGSFGSNKFRVEAYVYDTKEDLEKAKQLSQKQRKEIAKAAAEAKKAEEEAKKAAAEKSSETSSE